MVCAKKLQYSFTKPLSVRNPRPPLPYSGYPCSMTQKHCGLGTYVTQRASMHVFQKRMGTDACHPEPGVWAAHVLPDLNHRRQKTKIWPFFFFSVEHKRLQMLHDLRGEKKNPNEYLHHVAEYTLSALERKTLTVRLLFPSLLPLLKNKCRDGRASEGSAQIMWEGPRVPSLLFSCKKCDTGRVFLFKLNPTAELL